MTAYNETELYNLAVRNEANSAFKKGYISKENFDEILTAHQLSLYSPNLFVKIGLGFLTCFIILASLGLLFLLFQVNTIGVFLVFGGITCYAALEIMTKERKHFNSGVDNMLMLFAPFLIITGISIESYNSETFTSLLAFLMLAWLAIRFADKLMAAVATLLLFNFILNGYSNIGEFTITSYPFILIAVSGSIYLISQKAKSNYKQLVYHACWQWVEIVSLLSFYAFGNYYFIEAATTNYYLLQGNSPLNISWFFWSWTLLLPIIYIVAGLIKRDMVLVRIGVLLLAAGILTYRYYFSVIPAEVALIFGGVIVTFISYWLFHYLKQPKHGFVFEEETEFQESNNDVEALVIGEVFDDKPVPFEEKAFGGGSFGGAGAGSAY